MGGQISKLCHFFVSFMEFVLRGTWSHLKPSAQSLSIQLVATNKLRNQLRNKLYLFAVIHEVNPRGICRCIGVMDTSVTSGLNALATSIFSFHLFWLHTVLHEVWGWEDESMCETVRSLWGILNIHDISCIHYIYICIIGVYIYIHNTHMHSFIRSFCFLVWTWNTNPSFCIENIQGKTCNSVFVNWSYLRQNSMSPFGGR